MTPPEIEAAMKEKGCVLVEDRGDFALVYPFGYEGRKRSQDLQAKTRDAALVEAWKWLHPEQRVAERIEIIQRMVAAEFGISIDLLCAGGRAEPMATARRVALALAATITPASTYLIGASFGREHGTVLYAKKSIEDQCAVDLPLAARVGTLRAQCQAAFEKAKL
jgi:chromosomal replication initiation ATPase DnaA